MQRLFASMTAAGGIAALVLLFTLAGPVTPQARSAQPPEGSAITGVVWQWHHTVTSTDVDVPDDPSRYTIEFLPDGRLNVRADCNQGGGPYQVSGNQLSIGPLAVTLAACPLGSLDSQFLRQLDDTGPFATGGSRLFIGLKSEVAVMIFVNPAAEQGP